MTMKPANAKLDVLQQIVSLARVFISYCSTEQLHNHNLILKVFFVNDNCHDSRHPPSVIFIAKMVGGASSFDACPCIPLMQPTSQKSLDLCKDAFSTSPHMGGWVWFKNKSPLTLSQNGRVRGVQPPPNQTIVLQ